MQPPYLSHSTKALLDEFGAGKHVPGAGSASALSGLLAAQLVLTVCRLTLDKESHRDHHAALLAITQRLQFFSIPALEKLLERDAGAFNLVYAERIARDNTSNPAQKQYHINAEHRYMKAAVAIPLEIAGICSEVADAAAKVFEVGLRHIRGDSGVALSTAVSSILSCVFVVNLNLKDFKRSHWSLQRQAECDELLRSVSAKFQAVLGSARSLRAEALLAAQQSDEPEPLVGFGTRAKQTYSDEEIEDRARRLGLQMWQRREQIWGALQAPNNPIKVLDPERALGTLGYSYELADALGTVRHGDSSYEVAGIFEAQPGLVRVSSQMLPEIRLFTAAHELGHVVLHPHLREAHRDRPLDGSERARDQLEREADKFAAAFLMPGKQVRLRFSTAFGNAPFLLDEATAFALQMDLAKLRKKLKTLRDLSLLLARAERFNGKNFNSLAKQFSVSVTTMAIRLEELGLVGLQHQPSSTSTLAN
ncbi:cyclodeaminase/cyclohydrolase family protein [Janthinobacterium sp. GW460P]|uniref:cyclodeaminase/cyclohydrolase family protein n=1 Tax=unclassified Janthinobacterium TaxID=2610881 RepID=UPI000A3255F6|nr:MULTISPECIES: cyclodeaminase/cyclohydrolase family protein [unclassified Janthinobacterium]MCC7705993.1 cyclodeaminase/cyclohydrolase family protein [Janthinobacterium sp. GW460P]MCC7711495.1 cyclodeaminase/cyclohydrolase family protein [Janthinobacterium sp. GW460W]